MAESAKKRIPGSNLAKMSPEKRAKVEAFRAALDEHLVEALRQGVRKNDEKRQRLMQAEQKQEKQGEDQDQEKD